MRRIGILVGLVAALLALHGAGPGALATPTTTISPASAPGRAATATATRATTGTAVATTGPTPAAAPRTGGGGGLDGSAGLPWLAALGAAALTLGLAAAVRRRRATR